MQYIRSGSMDDSPAYYTELLSADELHYLKGRLRQQRRGFYRSLFISLAVAAALTLIFGFVLMLTMHQPPEPMDYEHTKVLTDYEIMRLCLVVLGFIIAFILLAFALAFYATVYPLQRDIRQAYKVVERVVVAQKRYIRINHTFHFYFSKASRLSVEVSAGDFDMYQEGDEVNLEYTPYAKIDLGYF